MVYLRPIKGEWVRVPDGRVGRVASIERVHDTSGFEYKKPIMVQFGNSTDRYADEDLERLTYWDFVFDGPRGEKGFGKSSMVEAVVIHLFGLIIAIAPWVSEMSLPWGIFITTLGVGIPAVLWLKTWDNFTRRTV